MFDASARNSSKIGLLAIGAQQWSHRAFTNAIVAVAIRFGEWLTIHEMRQFFRRIVDNVDLLLPIVLTVR